MIGWENVANTIGKPTPGPLPVLVRRVTLPGVPLAVAPLFASAGRRIGVPSDGTRMAKCHPRYRSGGERSPASIADSSVVWDGFVEGVSSYFSRCTRQRQVARPRSLPPPASRIRQAVTVALCSLAMPPRSRCRRQRSQRDTSSSRSPSGGRGARCRSCRSGVPRWSRIRTHPRPMRRPFATRRRSRRDLGAPSKRASR